MSEADAINRRIDESIARRDQARLDQSRETSSQLLIELRRALDMTQSEFAKAIGHAWGTVARWETTHPPKGHRLVKMARFVEEKSRITKDTKLTGIAQRFRDLAQSEHQDAIEEITGVRHSPMPDRAGHLLRVTEAAALLNMAPKTIRNWIALGNIEKVVVGPRSVRVRKSELEAMVGTLSESPRKPEHARSHQVANSETEKALRAIARCASSMASSLAQLAQELQAIGGKAQ